MFDPLIILMRVLVISDGRGMVVYDPVPDVYVAGPSYPPPVIVQPSYVQPVYPNGTSLEPMKSSFSNHSDLLSSRFFCHRWCLPRQHWLQPGIPTGRIPTGVPAGCVCSRHGLATQQWGRLCCGHGACVVNKKHKITAIRVIAIVPFLLSLCFRELENKLIGMQHTMDDRMIY
jgi:hypothetical protein